MLLSTTKNRYRSIELNNKVLTTFSSFDKQTRSNVFFLISSPVTLSKRNKHQFTRMPSDSESGSFENPIGTEQGDDFEEQTRFDKVMRGYFNTKGTLRQNFAIEQAFQSSGSNVVCSPVSALLPLGKIVFGAEDPTREELYQAIGDHKKKDIENTFKTMIKELQFVPGVKLDLASKIYISDQADLLANFHDDVKEIFKSTVEKISFNSPKQAVDEINGWIARQTNGMIPLLLQPGQISAMSSLVIVNAIYFKGKWKEPFERVVNLQFHAPSGLIKIQLMMQHAVYRYTKSDVLNAQIVEIPYEGMEAAFIIVLPNEKFGLPLLLNQLKLAPNLLNSAMGNLTLERLELSIPKFTISSSLDLKEMYKKIGIKHMFGPRSGLTGIVKDQMLNISTAVQKAVIEVNERGTEAGTASAVLIATGGTPKYASQFVADHPFLFYVRVHDEQLLSGIFNGP